MKNLTRVASALALVASLSSAWAQESTVTDTKNLIDDGILTASLNAVRAEPHAYLKSRVEFEARFDDVGAIYQTFFTIFDSQTHANFSAWDSGNELATREGYLDNCPLLYLDRRRGDAMESLFGLEKYQRFRAVGVVQSVFADKPFIEVLTVTPLDRTWANDMHKRAALGIPAPADHHHHSMAAADPAAVEGETQSDALARSSQDDTGDKAAVVETTESPRIEEVPAAPATSVGVDAPETEADEASGSAGT